MESEGRIELLVMKYSNQSQKDEKKVNNQLDKFVWLWYIFWKSIVPWRSLEENIWWSSKYKQKYFWNQSLADVPNIPLGDDVVQSQWDKLSFEGVLALLFTYIFTLSAI